MESDSQIKLKAMQRLTLRLRGHVFVGYRTRPGWRGALPFYAFKCPEHGLVEDYPHGYKQILDCPLCKKARSPPLRVPQDEIRTPEIVS